MNQVFDINRAWNYGILKLNLNRKLLLIGLSSFFGLVFIISVFVSTFSQNVVQAMNIFHMVMMTILIFAGAIWVAGRSFQDMNTPEKSISQIMIPASTTEKFILPLFFSALFWLIAMTFIYVIFAFIINGIWGIVFGVNFGMFNPFDYIIMDHTFDIFQGFFLIHSIFFLGSIAFKTYPLGKTVLSIFAVQIFFNFVGFITGWILFGDLSHLNLADNENLIIFLQDFFTKETAENLLLGFKVVAYIVFPLIFYSAAFYKLKEREA